MGLARKKLPPGLVNGRRKKGKRQGSRYTAADKKDDFVKLTINYRDHKAVRENWREFNFFSLSPLWSLW